MNQEPSTPAAHRRDLFAFAEKLGVVAAVVLAIWLWNTAMEMWLLVFAGILCGITLHRASTFVSKWTRLSRKRALAIIGISLLAISVFTVWRVVPAVASQLQQLQETIPRSIGQVEEMLRSHTLGREAISAAGQANQALGMETVAKALAGMATSTLNTLAGLLVVLFMGMCFAIEPQMYVRGLLALVPPRFRSRSQEVLMEVEDTLAHWILARLASMLVVAVLVCIAMWALKIPLGFTLALLAGAFDFIPNIGPFLAAAPAVLLGFLESPIKAVYVAIAFLVIQMLEGYVFTPIIERKAVHLPPALTVAAQIILGLSAGILGVALAAPLTAAAIVLVRELYVQDYLEKGSGNAVPADESQGD